MSRNVAEDRVYKVREIAAILRLGEQAVYRMIRSGHLRAVKIGGGAVRILESDLRAMLESSGTK